MPEAGPISNNRGKRSRPLSPPIKKNTPMHLANLSTALLALLLLTGCEGGTTFTKEVRNESSETLTLRLHTSFLTTASDTFRIEPGSRETIYWNDKTGLFTDGSYTCVSEIDSVSVSLSRGKRLVKSLLDPDHWDRESKGGRNSTEKCTFTFSDSDLQ